MKQLHHLCCVVLVLGLSTSRSAVSADGVPNRVDRSLFIPLSIVVLKVEARQRDGGLQLGTGVTVAPGVVMTNCHVIGDAEQVTVSKRAGSWRARAIHAAVEHDLCYLKVPRWRGPPIEFSPLGVPKLRSPVASLGYTGGVEMSFSEGRVNGLYSFQDSVLIRTSASFSSGASGGALLDHRARLLGVLTFRLRARGNHYYAVPIAWVEANMPNEADWQPIGTSMDGEPFWQADVDELPFFMRAAPLEAQSRWQDLLTLSEQWWRSEPWNAEPWIVKSRALLNLGDQVGAIDALGQATRVDPRNADAWFQFGKVCHSNGDSACRDAAHVALAEINSSLSAEFERLIGE